MLSTSSSSRRNFLKGAAAVTIGSTLLGSMFNQVSAATGVAPAGVSAAGAAAEGLLVIGPVKGYTPQIGTLVSMLNYNRSTIVRSVQKLTTAQLDYLHDQYANSIAALIMHLGAVEKFYQINTFEGRQEFNAEEKKTWLAALELGDKGRQEIKGKDAQYYLDLIGSVREKTLEELKKKDDDWLLAVDPVWSKKDNPVNTYWKWFHVCEHESNHRGQIAFLKGRLPGAGKPGNE